EFTVGQMGRYYYTVEGWLDQFQTWRHDFIKRIQAAQEVEVDLLIGASLVSAASQKAEGADAERLRQWAAELSGKKSAEFRAQLALDEELGKLASHYADRRLATRYPHELPVTVERPVARFGAWYEMFPRSCSPELGRHGTFRDCEALLDYVGGMGFDILYLPPIHPIGRTNRKGKNNTTFCGPDDVGSPWAIGAKEGGHKSIHPQLGSMEDFEHLISRAGEYEIEIALDLAFQCATDHPYVKECPEWFRARPDGTIQYAENPPKKYQDIYPFDFESSEWRGLWEELRSVVTFWIEKGVHIFRVDNPHTKAFRFWEWLIADVKKEYPQVIFLSEAFTRPKVMYRLAKLGFSQSYTYFTWRNTKRELTEYFEELAQSPVREFLRPNLWPNTPDILPEYLQMGSRPAFVSRLVLAATLGASYGIYGPAFELCENEPKEPGSEEYLNSEKYELKHRNLDSPWSLKDFIARVNRIRRENQSLHHDWRLHFHAVDNDMVICYSKSTPDFSNVILVVVNLDFRHTQSGWVTLDLDALGLRESEPYQVHELLGEGRFLWQGMRNYVELDPQQAPAHIFRIRRKTRTERDFDYYL
ncbi:MAG TPA: maltotransferase domain-containing protein, partial [Bryobacteraceae bacterium]|nr:maltotransferase domain-containing protein [Bryobacteraceae bacterium]